MIDEKILLGTTEHHLIEFSPNRKLHFDVIAPLTLLKNEAKSHGFDLQVISGFRSFERQLIIWNQKVSGQKKIFNDQNEIIDPKNLSEIDLIHAIMRFSALPGLSRHHWGVDFDVFDANIKKAEEVQLTDYEATQEMGAFHEWLSMKIEKDEAHGFYRPYDVDRGGIAVEKWHLSYRPLSDLYYQAHSANLLKRQLSITDILLKSTILNHLDELFERFFLNIK
jgi:LAS superfamily LD-carboxypeptidase LdcB